MEWIRLFATKAANITIEKTDRQTEKLSTKIKTGTNDIATLANSQKTIYAKNKYYNLTLDLLQALLLPTRKHDSV